MDESVSPPGRAEAEAAARALEDAPPQEILRWGVERFGRSLVLACSFQAEDVVLVDMLCALQRRPRVFYLDTGLLFPETYRVRDLLAERYGLELERYAPALSVEEQARVHGPALWARDPDRCCALRKLEPLARALAGCAAWVAGIRREQSPTRAAVPVVDWDARFGKVKLHPLARWSWEQVRAYVARQGLPDHPLYAQGYASIGCWPCTSPVAPGEHPRAGRWRGRGKLECGLHVPAGGGAP